MRAFPDDRHLLVFNRYSATAVSEELRSLSNVSGRGIEGQDFARHVADFRPDVLFFHWYPPMSAVDFAGLPRETLNRGILFNHGSARYRMWRNCRIPVSQPHVVGPGRWRHPAGESARCSIRWRGVL